MDFLVVSSKISTVLTSYLSLRKSTKKVKDLWWNGLPSSVRGRVWKLAIGNDLHITPGQFSQFSISCIQVSDGQFCLLFEILSLLLVNLCYMH